MPVYKIADKRLAKRRKEEEEKEELEEALKMLEGASDGEGEGSNAEGDDDESGEESEEGDDDDMESIGTMDSEDGKSDSRGTVGRADKQIRAMMRITTARSGTATKRRRRMTKRAMLTMVSWLSAKLCLGRIAVWRARRSTTSRPLSLDAPRAASNAGCLAGQRPLYQRTLILHSLNYTGHA